MNQNKKEFFPEGMMGGKSRSPAARQWGLRVLNLHIPLKYLQFQEGYLIFL